MIGSYPSCRMRRLRQSDFVRSLRREHSLGDLELIAPVFLIGDGSEDIPGMPGQQRYGGAALLRHAELALERGVRALALFPASERRSVDASAAYDPNGLMPGAIRSIKQRFPELTLMSDVALDPYTASGQDGLTDVSGYVLNDATVGLLVQQAICHAEAGVDIIAPSDMMDGRVGAIRGALDARDFTQTLILSYTAKYASALYQPFRSAINSPLAVGGGDKRSYQMDPGNGDEALHEAFLDLQEGADMLMVKPGLAYLDVLWRLKDRFKVPTLAYQVSGEYVMVKVAAQAGYLNERDVVLEFLLSCKRAGANGVLTYFALDAAAWLN